MANWAARPSPFDGNYSQAVCWSPELAIFVATGDNDEATATSPDGVTWTEHTTPGTITGGGYAIVWAADLSLFVASSANGISPKLLMTSPNGVTWTARSTPWDGSGSSRFVRGLAWSPSLSLFVAVGVAFPTASFDCVLTSPDGVNWTERTTPFDDGSEAQAVCWAEDLGLFIAVGENDQVVMTSPDGINWTLQTTPFDSGGAGFGVCWSSSLGLAVVTGTDTDFVGAVMTSPDGINWTAQTIPYADGGTGKGVFDCDGRLVMVGDTSGGTGTSAIIESTDGINWNGDTSPFDPATSGYGRGGCYSPDLLLAIAVGQDGGGTGSSAIAAASFVPISGGVYVAFDDPTLEPDPTWTRLDDPDGYRLVRSWTIDRGRSSELDKTKTGEAVITLIDPDRTLDPGNADGPFYGKFDPMKQLKIDLHDPVANTDTTVFRGFVAEWPAQMNDADNVATVTLEATDAFDLFAAIELTPGQHGDTTGLSDFADVWFEGTPSNVPGVAAVFKHVDDRIMDLLDAAGWPGSGVKRGGLRDIFSGNVSVQGVVYARRDQLLQGLQDAGDAEFPGVANIFMSKTGVVSFRGRFARFFPERPGYGIGSWSCGDAAAVAGDSTVAPIAAEPSLAWRRSKNDVINACLALPQGVDDAGVPAQLVKDDTSIAAFGYRGLSYNDLLVSAGHDDDNNPTTALEECAKVENYYVGNYKDPKTRITTLAFRMNPNADNAAALCALICGVEIGDVIHTDTGFPEFDEDGFIEGIRYDAQPLGETTRLVTLELDVSPRSFFSENPFGEWDDT